ncbi:Protein SOGA [Trinorchestia longiramus]|nr:Protein SOGA [Trinorchestia longiramus]
MPKGGDPHCPLGFHPQFRRPNYCKRCFREYSEHKAKDLSGSTSSINSLTSYDPNTNSFVKKSDGDSNSLYGSRDSLVSTTRQKDEVEGGAKKAPLARSYSEDKPEKDTEKSWLSSKSTGSSWSKSRPMSWSAQDLRQAVNEAKESVSSSKDDVYSSFGGSTKSLDKDAGYESKSSSNNDKKDQDGSGYSFSSYLAMRTKSPGRPPSLLDADTKESTKNGSIFKDEEGESTITLKPSSRTSSSSSSESPKALSLARSSLSSVTEARPPRAPMRIKERSLSAKLPDLRENSSEISESKPKTILSLKHLDLQGEGKLASKEVKSMDDSETDASYVIRLKPKTKKVGIDLNSEVERLQKENKILEKEMKELSEKYKELENDNKELSAKKSKFGDVRKSSDITKLQHKIDELSDDNKVKNKEVKELKKEIDKRPLPKDVEKTINDLRSKLQAAEQLCEELMDENEDYKKEIRAMEEEIEEMQDNFREDQADEYRDLKRELEQRAKDCRVMQFKLKKAERRADALERDKCEAEDKLRELQLGDQDIDRVEKIKSLEKELTLAKEVSLKMHEEMEKTKKELEVAESDKKQLKEKVADSPSKVSGGRYSRSAMMGRQGSQDNMDQLLRDLQATQEREQDLKEQLRFAEEEAKGMRKKLSRIEEENETLQLQLNKMSTKAKVNRQRSLERSGSVERQGSVERGSLSRQGSIEKNDKKIPPVEDLDPTDMKIQMELNEQESAVLRRKLETAESENERLQREIKELLSFKDNKKTNSLGKPPEPSRDNVFFDKKIKMLEEELTELRKKLIDSETERDQLRSDLDLTKKRSKMTRSRSTEQLEADTKKKMEYLEKECDGLRLKSDELMAECDKLLEENRRLQEKSNKRLPLTPQENVYVENQVLQDKVKRLEKRLKDSTQKVKTLENFSNAMGGSDRDAEINDLKNKINELQGNTEDMKKLVSGARIPKVPKDTTPKSTLVKWVNELEHECTQLLSTVLLLETEKEVFLKLNKSGRSEPSYSSLDGEMCNILIAETNKLKGDVENLKQSLGWKENEVKQLKRKLRDSEMVFRENQNELKQLRSEEMRIERMVNAGQRSDYQTSELTSKSTLRRFVDELNRECARLQLSLKESEKKKSSISRTSSGDVGNLQDLKDQLAREKERVEELTHQLKEEREKSDKNTTMDRRLVQRADDLRRYEDKIESLKRELEDEKEKTSDLRAQVKEGSLVGFDELRAAQSDKHRTQKELSAAQQTINTLEKRMKEAEESIRVAEKTEKNLRSSVCKSEAKLEEERSLLSAAEERHKEMSVSWLKEREDLKKEITSIRRNKEKAEEEVKRAQKSLENAESKCSKEQKKLQDLKESQKKDTEEMRKVKNENEKLLSDLDDLKDTLFRVERDKEKLGSKINKETEALKAENADLQVRMNTLESELKAEKAKRERLEKENSSSRSLRGQSASLSEVQKKLTKSEQEVKRLSAELEEAKLSFTEKLEDLEKTKKKEHQELVDLQVKYDLLEEDFVVQKAQYSSNKGGSSEDYKTLKVEYDTIEEELKKLRETYNLRQDTWIKEKLSMQEQVKDLETRLTRPAGETGSFMEKNRLKDILDDKNHQIEKLKRDEEILRDQLTYARREGEELRRKVDDLEKINELNDRRQTKTNPDVSEYEDTIKDLRSRLSASEKVVKTETTKIKMKYDSKLKALAEEVSTLSSHMSKYRRERDRYKELMEAAQKNLSVMRSGGNTNSTSQYRTSRADNANEVASFEAQILDYQSQITELEDKLADYRLETTKLKNDLVDVKTNADIQLCEAQTKLNEYEEDRLLGGGSRKVPGLRTRLELNWQKEREEQQRLLQETATLAKDLRQTLYEVERERDMEKLEAKRKIEQLKRSVNVDQQDTIGKVQELQRDLQELREAHAKLRQINEKLRREKDRTEVEREAMRDKYLGGSRESLNQQAKVERISEEMRKIRDLAPLILGESIDGREASLTNLSSDAKPKTKEEFTEALKKLVRGMDDLKGMMGLYDDRDRIRRATSLRRALSIESDDEGSIAGSLRSRSVGRGGLHRPHHLTKQQKSNLHRKAQSLDHQMAEERGKIWVSTDVGSTSSIESSMTEEMRKAKYDRDASLDRISTGSQTSEVDGDKKVKGIKGIFSKLSKARSIEDSPTGGSIVDVGVKV